MFKDKLLLQDTCVLYHVHYQVTFNDKQLQMLKPTTELRISTQHTHLKIALLTYKFSELREKTK